MSLTPMDPYDAEIASAAMAAVDATLVAARKEYARGFLDGLSAAARWIEEASAVMLIDAPEKIRKLAPSEAARGEP